MSAYFSDLQENENKRWYNVVADRHWELQQVAKLYRSPLVFRSGRAHVEIPERRRQELSFLEDKTKKRVSPYSSVARDALGFAGSDYFQTRRVTDGERENRSGSLDRMTSEKKYGGDPGVYGKESKYGDAGVIHGADILNFV